MPSKLVHKRLGELLLLGATLALFLGFLPKEKEKLDNKCALSEAFPHSQRW